MTKRECAIVEAFTGVVMLEGADREYYYDYLKKIFGRSIYTHQLLSLANEVKERAREDFIALCREATDDTAVS